MFLPKAILLLLIIVISTIKADPNDVKVIQLRDNPEVQVTVARPANVVGTIKLRSKGDELGCCVYKTKVWESNKDVWESPDRGCSAPGEFQVREKCYWSVSYDKQLEMPNIISIEANDTFDSKGADSSQPVNNVVSAAVWFRSYRCCYLDRFPAAPQTPFNCRYYAGNDQKPTCHNITNAGGRCIYVYNPVTQQFRFANRTCEGSQQLVTWPNTTSSCFRHNSSWEYTCIGSGTGKDIMNMLIVSQLPLTPVGCCNYDRVMSNEVSTWENECSGELWKRVQPNTTCHYILERKTAAETVKVLLLIFTEESVNLRSSCGRIEYHLNLGFKSDVLFHCQCPASTDRHSTDCLKEMFELAGEY